MSDQSPRLTDRRAIAIALNIAIDTEESLIDAYRQRFTGKIDEDEEGVKIARRRIAAFKRVQAKYGLEGPTRSAGVAISIFDIMEGAIDPDGAASPEALPSTKGLAAASLPTIADPVKEEGR